MGRCDQENIKRLQKVKNFAVRIVTDAHKFEHFTPYLIDLYWLPVAIRLEVRDIIMTYKSLNGNVRNKDKLQLPLCRTTTAYRSFKYSDTFLWNSLPKNIGDNSSSILKNNESCFLYIFN